MDDEASSVISLSVDDCLTLNSAEKSTAYWKQQFIGLDSARFPLLPHSAYQPQTNKTYDHLIQDVTLVADATANSAFIRAAWATLLSWHSGSPDTVFGAMLVGRHADGSEPTVVPIRVIVDETMTVGVLLQQLRRQAEEMTPFEQTGLQHIQGSSEEAQRGCQFQTLLVEQPSSVWNSRKDLSGTYTIILACHVEDRSLRLRLMFDSNLMSEEDIKRIAHQLELILQQLCQAEMAMTNMSNLKATSKHDLSTIWKWNTNVPESVNMRVHQVFAERVWDNSASPAVCAWDGDLTYGQLDKLSTKLSYYLISLGVRPGTMMPLCFEKSMWVPVAILAVMKAGGASVLLDVTQPSERLRSILEQLPSTTLVLSSAAKAALAGKITQVPVITVSKASIETHQLNPEWPITPPSPADSASPLYIVFTSGSTGIPKGAIVTHDNFCSAIKHQQEALGFTTSSRVFDFTSYAFDVAWSNILHTLTAGGCLCIPSEEGRSTAADVANSIARLRANYLHITPTVARMLDPSALPGLRKVVFIGETLKRTDVARWKSNDVQVYNTYGPAECTVTSTIEAIDPHSEKGGDPGIGRAIGAVSWILRPDSKSLAAVGTIGELWLEGPIVGGGYLNNPDKTKAAFTEDPEWLLQGAPDWAVPGRRGRLYRTGDMVRYNADGSLFFTGRKDNQVKLRGQRVELGEIEHHIRELLPPEVKQLVAEVIIPEKTNTPTLALFFTGPGVSGQDLEDKAASLITNLQEGLVNRVTSYMIPSAYFPLSKLPMTASGKTDRKSLREMGASMDGAALFSKGNLAREPSTATEKKLQIIWASVLKLEPSHISANDSFLRLGGDSVLAMQLVATAREECIFLTVQDIFRQPKLQELAKLADSKGPTRKDEEAAQPLSLLRAGTDAEEARKKAAAMFSVDVSDIEDIFPCTPLQEGLLAMTAMSAGKYVSRSLVEILPDVDILKLQEAWEQIYAVAPILRTRIVDLPDQGLVQVVLRQRLAWLTSDSLEEYRLKEHKSECQNAMGLGTELTCLGIVHDRTAHKTYLSWTQHHAIYDGWSLQLLQEAVEKAYFGVQVKPMASLQALVQYLLQSDRGEEEAFWKRQFRGLEAQQFPALPVATYQPNADKVIEHCIDSIQWPEDDITASTIIRTAWATLLSWQCASQDTVFGAVVLGRQAPVPGVESLAGPTIATVPLRIVVNGEATVMQLLEQVQNQSTDMILYEQTGLQRIRRISEEADRGCQFQSLLVVQPAKGSNRQSNVFKKAIDDEDDANVRTGDSQESGMDAFSTHAITLSCQIDTSRLDLRIHFDSNVVSENDIKRLSQCLEHIIRQLCQPNLATTRIRDLSMASELDLRTIWTWNASPLTAVDACVHELIAERVREDPNAMAICAWDGELTYGELDDLSTRLAHELIDLGVRPGTIVPLCFQKSMWVPVSKLAVMKAGGASVTMDSTQPEERLKSIVQQVGSHIILSGTSTSSLASAIAGRPAFVVCSETLPRIHPLPTVESQQETELPVVKPTDLLYLVFTSGSTGAPKGAMMTHSNFATATKHHGPALGFKKTSRVADFASYAFDVSWANFLNTMAAGGCLCIPSEEDRQHDFVGFMSRFQVNYVDLTPSVAALLDLNVVPQLETVVVGGELVELDKLQHLQDLKQCS